MEPIGKQRRQSATSTAKKVAPKKGLDSRPKSAIKNGRKAGMRPGRNAAIDSQADHGSAPGTYDVKGMSFGENTKSMTIGVKRESRVERSPGPGEYDANRSDSLTKSRPPQSVNFDKTTGRGEGTSPARDSSPDFGETDRFYHYPKEKPIYSIGQKRPEKPRDGPGPGEYNLDDSATKPRTSGYHQF